MNRLLLYSAVLLLIQCSKCKDDDPSPEEQLPPTTQTGANTFDCLVNGQPWTPQGSRANGTSNFVLTYDPGYAGGALQVKVYRFTGAGSNTLQSIIFGAANVAGTGRYSFALPNTNGINYSDVSKASPCNYYGDPPSITYRKGTLTVTRLDMQAGVVAGTFEFTLAQPGCDTIRVTHGRFDYKL